MAVSITEISAEVTTVVGLRRGDLLDDKPLEHPTLILDGIDDVVLVAGSPDQLESLARSVRREVDAIHAGLGAAPEAAINGIKPPVTVSSPRAGELPPTLDYIAVDPDGLLRVVSAIVTTGGSLPILQSAVGGHIELVQTTDKIDGYANEEGLLLRLPYNRIGGLVHQRLRGIDRALDLVGTIVFIGTDGEETFSLTAEQRRHIVEAWIAANRDRYRD
jgi:hypothetical protein